MSGAHRLVAPVAVCGPGRARASGFAALFQVVRLVDVLAMSPVAAQVDRAADDVAPPDRARPGSPTASATAAGRWRRTPSRGRTVRPRRRCRSLRPAAREPARARLPAGSRRRRPLPAAPAAPPVPRAPAAPPVPGRRRSRRPSPSSRRFPLRLPCRGAAGARRAARAGAPPVPVSPPVASCRRPVAPPVPVSPPVPDCPQPRSAVIPSSAIVLQIFMLPSSRRRSRRG